MHVVLNDDRSQKILLSGYAAQKYPDAIEVDCKSPDENYRLKVDYTNFAGIDQWEVNTGKKQEVLQELKTKFNAQTEQKIVNSVVAYQNANGEIHLKCNYLNQQNFTALFIRRDTLSYPYEIWEGDQSLALADASEVTAVCTSLMSEVERIRRERKAIRDTFNGKTAAEIIDLIN
jgi:hypothetical protein